MNSWMNSLFELDITTFSILRWAILESLKQVEEKLNCDKQCFSLVIEVENTLTTLPLFYASYPYSIELKNRLVFCLLGSKDALLLAGFFLSALL